MQHSRQLSAHLRVHPATVGTEGATLRIALLVRGVLAAVQHIGLVQQHTYFQLCSIHMIP